MAELAHTVNGKTTRYAFEYDSLGRLIRSRELSDNGFIQRTEHIYDEFNRLKRQNWVLGTKAYSESYTYNDGTEENPETAAFPP